MNNEKFSDFTAVEARLSTLRHSHEEFYSFYRQIADDFGKPTPQLEYWAEVIGEQDSLSNWISRMGRRYGGIIAQPIIKHGNTLIIGTYPQQTKDDKMAIEWQILLEEGNAALVVSKYGIDCKQYNKTRVPVKWENCSLREWLNQEFIDVAFTTGEQNSILNKNNDRIFLLKKEDAEALFKTEEERKCIPTQYARKNGVLADLSFVKEGNPTCFWWLQSSERNWRYAETVYRAGRIDTLDVDNSIVAVRPAMWVKGPFHEESDRAALLSTLTKGVEGIIDQKKEGVYNGDKS